MYHVFFSIIQGVFVQKTTLSSPVYYF